MDFFSPQLEILELDIDLRYVQSTQFKGEMPLPRKTDIKLVHFEKEHVLVIAAFLSSMGNIQELELYILPAVSDPFHVLLEPDKKPLILPNLKSFSLSTCLWKETFEDLICLLQYLPVIETLILTHLDPIDKRMKKSF